MRLVWIALAVVLGCGGPQVRAAATGAIAGLVRARDTGDPIADVAVRIRGLGAPFATHSRHNGLFDVDHLAPGRYTLSARHGGQTVEVVNIDVRAGELSVVDVIFTPGEVAPIRIDHGEPPNTTVERFTPRGLPASAAILEGAVSDTGTRRRVGGAVITIVAADGATHQAVSDDAGRYRFDGVVPGVYAVSAYYNVGGRGQIEVRRSDIEVRGGERVSVPLWIEMAR